MLFMATAFGKIEPKYGAYPWCYPKTCSKISAQMLAKHNSIFYIVYFIMATLCILVGEIDSRRQHRPQLNFGTFLQ
jgi:hypothetical protein